MNIQVSFEDIKAFGINKALFLGFIKQNPEKQKLKKLKEVLPEDEIQSIMVSLIREGFLSSNGSKFTINNQEIETPKDAYKKLIEKKKEIERKKKTIKKKYSFSQGKYNNEPISYSIEDKAEKLVEHWNSLGMIRHNRGSKVFAKSIGALSVYLKSNMPMEKIKRHMLRFKNSINKAQLFPIEDYFIPLDQYIQFDEVFLLMLSRHNKKAYNIYYNIPNDSIFETSLDTKDDDEFIDLFSKPAPKDKTGLSKEIETSYIEFMEKRGQKPTIKDVQRNMFFKIGKKLKLFVEVNLDLISKRFIRDDVIKTSMIFTNFIFNPFENSNNFRLFFLLSDNFWQSQFIDYLYERGILER